MSGRVTLGPPVGAVARIDTQRDSFGTIDLTLQLPLTHAVTGRPIGAFQIQGWHWPPYVRRTGEVAPAESYFSVSLRGPRGGQHGTAVRLERTHVRDLAIGLTDIGQVATDIAAFRVSQSPTVIGDTDRERIYLAARLAYDTKGAAALWTTGARGAVREPIFPVRADDLLHCAGLCRLAFEVIA